MASESCRQRSVRQSRLPSASMRLLVTASVLSRMLVVVADDSLMISATRCATRGARRNGGQASISSRQAAIRLCRTAKGMILTVATTCPLRTGV